MATSKWVLDPTHSELAFKVKHMMISTVTGYFEQFEGQLETDDENFKNASVEISVEVASISTNNADRDGHLKSDDFFNAEAFPKMTFKSKSFDGSTLTGDLTIRDITKEVALDVEYNGTAVDPYGQTKSGFEVTGEINRKEFNLSWSAVTEAGSIVVSDKVKIVGAVHYVKQ
jgi:polyisoprenoid-binding protein YceI